MSDDIVGAVLKDSRKSRKHATCYPCQRRKVKCDRGSPCSVCIARGHSFLCLYGQSAIPKQTKPVSKHKDTDDCPATEFLDAAANATEMSTLRKQLASFHGELLRLRSHHRHCEALQDELEQLRARCGGYEGANSKRRRKTSSHTTDTTGAPAHADYQITTTFSQFAGSINTGTTKQTDCSSSMDKSVNSCAPEVGRSLSPTLSASTDRSRPVSRDASHASRSTSRETSSGRVPCDHIDSGIVRGSSMNMAEATYSTTCSSSQTGTDGPEDRKITERVKNQSTYQMYHIPCSRHEQAMAYRDPSKLASYSHPAAVQPSTTLQSQHSSMPSSRTMSSHDLTVFLNSDFVDTTSVPFTEPVRQNTASMGHSALQMLFPGYATDPKMNAVDFDPNVPCPLTWSGPQIHPPMVATSDVEVLEQNYAQYYAKLFGTN